MKSSSFACAVSIALASLTHAATTSYTGGSDWNLPGNWSGGIPSGTIDAVIQSGQTAVVNSATTPSYTGSLTLESGAEVDMREDIANYNALGTGTITMNTGSVLRIRTGSTTNDLTISNNINFVGDASILNSSNPTDNENRFITGVLSGTGQFTYGMRRGNLLALAGSAANTISGGMVFNFSDTNFGNTSRVRADKNGAFGTGNVTINDGIYLELINSSVTDAIADTAILYLDDRGEHASPLEKVTLGTGVTETVGGLVYYDYATGSAVEVTLAAGTYGRDVNQVTYTASDLSVRPLFDGSGTITVVPEPSVALFSGLGVMLLLRRRKR